MSENISSHASSRPGRAASVACFGLCLALAATALPAQADKPRMRPGIGPVPAFICIATTITDRGHTRQSRVIRSSGNPQSDRAALRLASRLKFVDDDGKASLPEREASMLVRMHQSGRHAFKLYEADEELPEICSTPAEV